MSLSQAILDLADAMEEDCNEGRVDEGGEVARAVLWGYALALRATVKAVEGPASCSPALVDRESGGATP